MIPHDTCVTVTSVETSYRQHPILIRVVWTGKDLSMIPAALLKWNQLAVIHILLMVAVVFSSKLLGEIKSCAGWRLNHLPEVKRFLKEVSYVSSILSLTNRYRVHHLYSLIILTTRSITQPYLLVRRLCFKRYMEYLAWDSFNLIALK